MNEQIYFSKSLHTFKPLFCFNPGASLQFRIDVQHRHLVVDGAPLAFALVCQMHSREPPEGGWRVELSTVRAQQQYSSS